MRIIFFFILCACIKANAQTVINYANATGTNCLFTSATNVPATVNGASSHASHLTTVGQINRNSVGNTLSFESNTNSGIKGSEYRIAYNFKQNYNYSIVVNAKGNNSLGGSLPI